MAAISSLTNASYKNYWFLESDTSDNQDWVAATGDPGDADLSNFTLYGDYFHFHIEESTDRILDFMWQEDQFSEGEGWEHTIGEESEVFIAMGELGSLAEAEGAIKFFKAHNRDSANILYVGKRVGDTSWEQFYDNNISAANYGRFICKNLVIKHIEAESEIYKIAVRGAIVWR